MTKISPITHHISHITYRVSRFTLHASRFTLPASRLHASRLFLSLALFLLALLPRLPDLGRFLTADEFLWVDRSRNFLAGMTDPAYQCDSVVEKWQFVAQGLACTLRTGHPGVTTMWTGSFGFLLRWLWDGRPSSLHDYVVAVSTNPLDASFIAPERLGTVLISSLGVVAVYWLARRLFGASLALLGAVLIALDPFHIALSRVIHHDALSTTFMTLSVLCAFIYWGESSQKSEVRSQKSEVRSQKVEIEGRFLQSRIWLLLSGLLAGLAFLSKSPSLFLMPFIALTGLWFSVKSGRMKNEGGKRYFILHPSSFILLILDGLLWFAVAIAVVFIFWPAMWVAPRETIETVIFIGSKYASGGHAKGNFFWGEVSQDPGALFYPVTWLYRTSPLVIAGVIAALIAWLVNWRIPYRAAHRGPPALRSLPSGRVSESANTLPGSAQPPSGTGQRIDKSANVEPENKTSSFIPHPSSFINYLPLILLFILGFYLLMTLGEKKQDRYFLPVYPWLNFIAAAGLISILDFGFWILDFYGLRISLHASRFTFHVSRFTSVFALLLLIILTVNGFLVAANFPYYFTYYNPLLGGIQGAAQAVTIGWGEGLDLAADYLNQHRDPSRTRVASWYESTFAPFYQGDSISYSKEKGKVLAGDYVIFYINQTQRHFPDDALFDYFEARFKPEKTITLHGLDYAWIYPSLGVDHYLEDQTYTGIASLLAWQWADGHAPLIPNQPGDFELYWEYLGKQPDEPFFFRVVDGQERLWAEAQSRPVAAENPPPEQWREGEIIVERGTLLLPPGTPPGQYRLQIGFYTQAPAVTEGELLFTLPDTENLITVGHADHSLIYQLPASATPIEQRLGDSLILLGASWPTQNLLQSPRPSDGQSNLQSSTPVTFPLDLYWRVEKAIPADFELHVGLMDKTGVAQQGWFNLSLAETLNPTETTWQPGDIIHTSWQLSLLPEVPAGAYTFDLVLPTPTVDGQTESLSFGKLMIGAEEVSKK